MAWYTQARVRYRGRLIIVVERYGRFQSAYVEKGKPLKITRDVEMDIIRLTFRKKVRDEFDEQERFIQDPCSTCEYFRRH